MRAFGLVGEALVAVGVGERGNALFLQRGGKVAHGLTINAAFRGDEEGLGVLRKRGVLIHREHLIQVGAGVVVDAVGRVEGGRVGEEILRGLERVLAKFVGADFFEQTRDVGDFNAASGGVERFGEDGLGLLGFNLIEHINQAEAQ